MRILYTHIPHWAIMTDLLEGSSSHHPIVTRISLSWIREEVTILIAGPNPHTKQDCQWYRKAGKHTAWLGLVLGPRVQLERVCLCMSVLPWRAIMRDSPGLAEETPPVSYLPVIFARIGTSSHSDLLSPFWPPPAIL